MKKAKFSLALVAGLVATIGLSSCNEVTRNGSKVLTFHDGQGTEISLTAEEMFADYQKSSNAKSTNFDKVYELLIRKYYADPTRAADLKTIRSKASNSVNQDMKTAANNAENGSSTYSQELEKILSSHGVETIDEDYEYWIYQHEKELFETRFYNEHIDDLRDYGFTGGTSENNDLNNGNWLNASTNPLLKDEGYLKEKMPYHVRHILRKVTAASGALTQAKVAATEAKNLAKVITELGNGECTFGEIAFSLSEDGSATSYGDLGKMDLDESYVNEFKLGVYAYDTIYRNQSNENAHKVAPVDDRTVTSNDGSTMTVYDYFKDLGIGTIPYGAAIGLAKAAEIDSSKLGYKINEDNDAFLPRNILFNKYFNKHNVCVITPNEIAYNASVDDAGKPVSDPTGITAYTDAGTLSETYAELKGFSHQDKVNGLLPNNQKVLTDERGNVVLVVRAGSTGSYEGIHFIVVERSALEETANGTTLSEYWTTEVTNDEKITYVNGFLHQEPAAQIERAEKVKGWIKGYNTNINSFIFAWLINNNNITFNAESGLEETIHSYVVNKIEQSKKAADKTRSDTWKTYAEFLIHQNEIRSIGAEDGMGELISETCAIGYLGESAKEGTHLWAKGGACYGK